MIAWLLPGAAGAFWLGLLAWTAVEGRLSPWHLLAAGLALLVLAAGLAPRRGGRDPLADAGLIEGREEPPAVAALGATRIEPGRGPPGAALVCTALALAILGAAWGGLHAERTRSSLLARLAPERVTVTGSLRTDPSSHPSGWSAVLDVRTVAWAQGAASVRGTVWVSGRREPPSAVRGDVLTVEGSLERSDPSTDFGRSMALRGISAELRADRVVAARRASNPVVRAAQLFRRFVGDSIARLFPPREAGLLMGLALGDDSRLDPALVRDFQATGLGHLLVVSGENVAMVLAPVLGLAMLLHLSRVPRFVLGAGTVVFFVVLTGAEPSVMRAGVMAVLALVGVLLGRPRSVGTILAGAVLVLLIVDPALVWSVGYQLSVAATAGMVALANPLAERLRLLPRPVALAAGTTLAAQAGVTPILLFHFREVPVSTLPANLLAFPAVSPALLLGLFAAAVGLAVHPAGRLLAMVALVPMRYLEMVADRLARAPVPWITSGGGAATLVIGLAAVGAAAWWLRSGRRLPRTAVAVVAAILPLAVWTSALSAGPPSGLQVRFLDVGQGDAALVSSPDGARLLIDAGPDPEQVATELSALGVKRLDAVIATHPHADHIVGFPAVFARFPVGLVLEPGCDEPSPSYTDLIRAIREEHLPVQHPRAGDRIWVGDVLLQVLAPHACFSGTDSDPNNDSLVIRLVYRGDVVLFSGDAEVPEQEVLLEDDIAVQAPLLKVPHHGGDTSIPDFFDAVDAQVAVVSVGQPNDYGHPVPSVLETLHRTGARLLRTDLRGDIVVTFAPGGLLVQSGG